MNKAQLLQLHTIFSFLLLLSNGWTTETCNSVTNRIHLNLHRAKRGVGDAFTQLLYSPQDKVVELNVNTFNSTVLNAEKAHLVQFYYHWCGHCRRFSKFYKEFARNVDRWSEVVQVTAINCADDKNADTCTSMGVHSVPQMKYYPRRLEDFSKSVPVSNFTSLSPVTQETYHSVSDLENQLAETVLKEYKIKKYPDWSRIDLLSQSESIEQLWNSTADFRLKYLVAVFEKDSNTLTGVKIILDLWKEKIWVKARRALSNHSLASAVAADYIPGIAVFSKGNNTPIQVFKNRSLALTEIMKLKGNVSTTTIIPVTLPTPFNATLQKKNYFVSETDILLASWYSLYHEVPFGGKGISGQNFSYLVDYVNTLKNYFPSQSAGNTSGTSQELDRSSRARQVFADLASFLGNKVDNTTNADEWKNEFELAEKKHGNPFPKNADWVHCKGSAPQFRGYTCGLWTTFHTLTVHAYLQDGSKADFNPLMVPKSIQGWVRTWFGCEHCAQHFMEMTTKLYKMEDGIKNATDVVMYLWRAHNIVNKRLKGDNTEDPTFPKLQFPAKFLCDSCQDPPVEDGKRNWDSHEVMTYLVKYYTDVVPHSALNGKNNGTDFNIPKKSDV